MIYDVKQLNNQHALVELLLVLMANKNAYMSTIDLQESGVLSPAAGIARLKEQGVIVETIYQTKVDRFGTPRKRIACYKIIGGVAL